MRKLILQIIIGILGIWLAVKFVPGVEFSGKIKILLLSGLILGLLNFFLKPTLKVITLPLRILTLGLFSFLLNMFIVWLVDIIFPELIIPGIAPLFWTTLIVWGLNLILSKWWPEKYKRYSTPGVK